MSRPTLKTPSSVNSIFARIRSFRHQLDTSTASTSSHSDRGEGNDALDPPSPSTPRPTLRSPIQSKPSSDDQSTIQTQPAINISALSSLPTLSPLRPQDKFENDSLFHSQPPFTGNISALSNDTTLDELHRDSNRLEMPMTPQMLSTPAISSSNVLRSGIERARSNQRYHSKRPYTATPSILDQDRDIERLQMPTSGPSQRSELSKRSKRSKHSNHSKPSLHSKRSKVSLSPTITPSMDSPGSLANVYQKLESFRVSLDDTPRGTTSNEWRRRHHEVSKFEIESLNLTMPSLLQTRGPTATESEGDVLSVDVATSPSVNIANLSFESQIIANIPSDVSPQKIIKSTAKRSKMTQSTKMQTTEPPISEDIDSENVGSENAVNPLMASNRRPTNKGNTLQPQRAADGVIGVKASNSTRKSQRLDLKELMSLPAPSEDDDDGNDHESQIRSILDPPPLRMDTEPHPQRPRQSASRSYSGSASPSPSTASLRSSSAVQIAEAMASHRNAMPHYYYTSPSVISDAPTIPTHLLAQSLTSKQRTKSRPSQAMSLQSAFRKHRESVDLKRALRQSQKTQKTQKLQKGHRQKAKRSTTAKATNPAMERQGDRRRGRDRLRRPQVEAHRHHHHGHGDLCGCSCHGDEDSQSRTPLLSPSRDGQDGRNKGDGLHRRKEHIQRSGERERMSVTTNTMTMHGLKHDKGKRSSARRGRRGKRPRAPVLSPQIAVEIKRTKRRKTKSTKKRAASGGLSGMDSETILEDHAKNRWLNLSGGVIEDVVRLSAISPSPIWFEHRQKLHIQEIRSYSMQHQMVSTVCCALWTQHQLEVLKLFKLSWSQRIMAFASPSVMFYVMEGRGGGRGGNMAKRLLETAERRFDGLDFVKVRYRLNGRRHRFALMCIVDAHYVLNENEHYFVDHRHCIPSYLIRNKT